MKTSNLFLFALTLFGVLDASKKGGNSKSNAKGGRRQIPRTRITRTNDEASTDSSEVDSTFGISASSRPFPVHRLLMIEYNRAFPETSEKTVDPSVVLNYFNGKSATQTVADDEKSIKSLSDHEVEGLKISSKSEAPKLCKRKSNKKRTNDDLDKFDENDAADVLMTMSKSGGNAEIELEDNSDKHKSKKEKKEKETVFPPLMEVTENMLLRDSIKKYSNYFDERNMSTVGSETLFKCMSNSMSPKLATFLIKNGARLSDTEESAIIALMAKDEGEDVRTKLFRVLLEEDPVSVARIFIRAAGMTEAEDETVDMFFFALLVDMVDNLAQKQTDLLIDIIEVIADSDRFANTLELLFGDRNRLSDLFSRALKSGKVKFIEFVFELGFFNINDKISVTADGREQVLASALFGRIEPSKIFELMQKFGYDMRTSNDPTVNPEGDILLAALAVRDLKSFKKLLMLGASLNVRVGVEQQLLEDFVRENEQEFFEAIQSLKNGTLQAEIEAEDSEEIDAPDAMLSASSISASSSNTREQVIIDLSMDD